MLVLARKVGQQIIIGEEIEITVLEVRGEQVRLGINAPRSVSVHRSELLRQVAEENLRAAKSDSDVITAVGEVMAEKKPSETDTPEEATGSA